MIIKNASADNIKSIAALYIKNHKSTYAGILAPEYFNTLTEAAVEKKWADYIAQKENYLFVALGDAALLGFAAAKPDGEIPGCLCLDSLHVDESARGKGIGTLLLKRVASCALKSGCGSMSICVVKGNNRAKALYEKLGARLYKNFTDDFHGTYFNSEKLIWSDLSCFEVKTQ